MKKNLLILFVLVFHLAFAELSFVIGELPMENIPQYLGAFPGGQDFESGLIKQWETAEGYTVISLLAGPDLLFIKAEISLGRKAIAETTLSDTKFSDNEDAISFYFDPNLLHKSYRFIGVNSADIKNDGINNSFRRNFNVKTETKVNDNGWQVILSVPYKDLDISAEQGNNFGLTIRQKKSFLVGDINSSDQWLPLSASHIATELKLKKEEDYIVCSAENFNNGTFFYDSLSGLQKVEFAFANGIGKAKLEAKNPPSRVPLFFVGIDQQKKRYSKRLYCEYYKDVYKGQKFGEKLISTKDFTIWTTPSMLKITADETIPDKVADTLNVELARNEYEGLPVHIKATKDEELQITFTSLINENGKVFPLGNIDLYFLKTLQITQFSDITGYTGEWQDPMIPLENNALKCLKNRNTSFYLRIYADKAIEAGIYQGQIKLSSAEQTIAIPLQIKVFDFTISDKNHTKTAYGLFSRFYDYLGLKTKEQQKEYFKSICREMSKYRIDPSNALTRFIEIKDPYGEPDFSELDERLDFLLNELNFTAVNLAHFINWGLPEELTFRYNQKYTNEQIQVKRLFFEKLRKHLREKDAFKSLYWYEIDEPNPGILNNVARYMDEVTELFPEIHRLMVLHISQSDELLGKFDAWCPLMDAYDNNTKWWKERQEQGDVLWWYTCNFPRYPYPTNFIDAPLIMPRIRAWLAEKFNIAGELYWAVDYLTSKNGVYESPYEQPFIANWTNGEGLLFWPPSFTAAKEPVMTPPWPSLRLEMTRDGIEDREYFYEAKTALGKLKQKPRANKRLIVALEEILNIPDELAKSPTEYTYSPEKILDYRRKLADLIVVAQKELQKK